MNRVERLAAILLMLQQRACTSDEIARRFEVSRRTILRDVQALSEMGAPIIAREGPGGGYSLDPDYHTQPLPLTRNEAFLLLLALGALQPLSDLPFKREMTSLETKLRALLPQAEMSGAQGLLERVGINVPTREQRAPFLETLLQTAQAGQWVRVVYRSAERTTTQHLLPHQVYTENGLWYCQAYAHERGENRTYRIDRIQSIEPPADDFTPGSPHESLPYSHSSYPEIHARLTSHGADLMEGEPHIGRQVKRHPDGSGEIVLRCPPGELAWFARYFASLGSEIDILAPDELRQQVVKLAQYWLGLYTKR